MMSCSPLVMIQAYNALLVTLPEPAPPEAIRGEKPTMYYNQ